MSDYAKDVISQLLTLIGGPLATQDHAVKYLADVLAEEYERGKQHGADDRRMIEQQNRMQGREIKRLKGEIAKLKMLIAVNADPKESIASRGYPSPFKL